MTITQSGRYGTTSPAPGGHFAPCAAQWVAVMDNPIEQFRAALADAGITLHPSATIRADGALHRARAADDKAGALSIWFVLHPDAPASGAAGNWKTGARLTWCGKRQSALTATERAEIARRITEDRERAQVATEARHRDAAAKAARIWQQSAPAAARHPYLERKGIAPGIARQHGDALILPITDFNGTLHGLQFIDEQGQKRFISGMAKAGHFIPTHAEPDGTRPLWIAEGWATASTLAMLKPGVCVIAALDAGNLQAVAVEARRRFPQIDLVIAADADAVGMEKAKAAAVESRAKWIWPRFPKDAPEGLSDFNDWSQWRKSPRQFSQGVAS